MNSPPKPTRKASPVQVQQQQLEHQKQKRHLHNSNAFRVEQHPAAPTPTKTDNSKSNINKSDVVVSPPASPSPLTTTSHDNHSGDDAHGKQHRSLVLIQSHVRRYIDQINNGEWRSVLRRLNFHSSIFSRVGKYRARMKWTQLKLLKDRY